MSSPFPQLLRRANIATYDPLISRIYTTTPSSQSRHSDWGLKFSIHRTKGPRYIKFNSLDSGPGFDCDWRSAEREARFIKLGVAERSDGHQSRSKERPTMRPELPHPSASVRAWLSLCWERKNGLGMWRA